MNNWQAPACKTLLLDQALNERLHLHQEYLLVGYILFEVFTDNDWWYGVLTTLRISFTVNYLTYFLNSVNTSSLQAIGTAVDRGGLT